MTRAAARARIARACESKARRTGRRSKAELASEEKRTRRTRKRGETVLAGTDVEENGRRSGGGEGGEGIIGERRSCRVTDAESRGNDYFLVF